MNSDLTASQESFNLEEWTPHAMFVCKKCKKICLIMKESWKPDNDNPNATKKSNSLKKTIVIALKDEKPWILEDQYNEQMQVLNSHENFDYPMCNSCTSVQTDRLRAQKSYCIKQNEFLTSKANINIKQVVESINNQIAAIKKETSVLVDVINSNEDGYRRSTLRQNSIVKQNDEPMKDDRTLVDPRDLSRGFGSYNFATAFSITTNRHYGVINTMRLGKDTPGHISSWEMDMAIYFLCQLMKLIANFTNTPTDEIIIGAGVTVLLSNNKIYLVNSHDIKTKYYTQYKEAWKVIMAVSHKIFNSKGISMTVHSPPNVINVKNFTIAGISYVYDKKKPQIFTAAARKLLYNYKFIQCQALRSALSKSV